MKGAPQKLALLFLSLSLALGLLGCSPQPAASPAPAEPTATEPAEIEPAPTEPEADEPEAGEPEPSEAPPATAAPTETEEMAFDPLGKYDPPITITAVRPIPDNLTFKEGEDIEHNIWMTTYMEELGIELKYDWVAPLAQYEERVNVSIMSNQLPDIIRVNPTQLQRMAENDQLADLTQAYEQYASELTKSIITAEGDSVLKSCTYNGKIVALPKTGSALGLTHVLWVRSDWLEKLSLPEPKTMEDVLSIARAFTEDDPDGNGKADTFGLGINKDLFGYFAALEGFFSGYHAYPNQWVEKDGQLVFGSVQPEAKAALQALQSLFLTGQVDKEFGTKDANKVKEDANAGKVGMLYGFFWNAGWLLDGKKANPEMEWTPYAIVSADDQPALVQVPVVVDTFYAVSKDSQHPESAVKMMNIMFEKIFGASADPGKYSVDEENNPVFEYPLIYGEPPAKNLIAQQKVVAALETKDTSGMNVEEKGYYDNVVSYLEGNIDQWGTNKMFGAGGSLGVINGYLEQEAYLVNAFYGAPTPIMVEKNATLSKLQLQVFTEIIMGGDIALFDEFVEDWNTLGGAEITQEVNDWFASR